MGRQHSFTILNLEKSYLEDTTTENTLTAKIMVFMVRGLFINLTFPYASFPSSSLSGDQLVPLFYKAIMRLERCGFEVSCITLDGNSVNRKSFKLVGNALVTIHNGKSISWTFIKKRVDLTAQVTI